ncbi:HAD family hydrolase [Gephyromycinifex aptenodytis]|uniref:HAD family hydrolase n=1 Tax=Gephyromycinifex aptenodytis TaxID=2716227 RepID=UPI0014476034|nr:HAD-IIB family hydrolase [Gephyromycinifex aptenodytis]
MFSTITRPVRRDLNLGTATGRHLVALDIDGTTLLHDGTLRPAVARGINAVREAGHEVVIATGRSLLATQPVLDQLGISHGYAVCSNGAVTIRLDPALPEGFRIVDQRTFDPGPALDALRQQWPTAVLAVERVGIGFDVNAPFPPGELDGRVNVLPWEELRRRPTTRVIFSDPCGDVDEFAAAVERIGLHGVNYAVGFTAWLDVAPEGVSKASALEQVRGQVGVCAQRTVAVGDQRNDLEMLAWAACGVAMGNAPDRVKAAADLVTGHVQDDGLLSVLAALPAAG